MNLVYTPYAALLHFTAMISSMVAFLALRRRATPGAKSLALLMFLVSEWAFTSGMEAASVDLPAKIIWAKLEYLGAVSAPTLFAIFSIEYSQLRRLLKIRNLVLLAVVPAAAFLLALTNEWHSLIWTSFTPSETVPNAIVYGHGIGYFILIFYDYAILLAGIIFLLKMWSESRQPYRRQVGAILLGSFFPFIAGILYSLGLNPFPGLDITPVSFSLTGLVLIFGLTRFRLFDLSPIPRDTLIENLDDGVIVLDLQNRIADINPMAQKLAGLSADNTLGRPAQVVLKSLPIWTKQFQESSGGKTDFRTNTIPPRFFELRSSLLYDRNQQVNGRVIVLRDITERRKTEMDLARKVEELNIINRISVAVTSGLDMEHVLKTLHEQCSQVAPMEIFYVALYDEANALIDVPLFYERGHYQKGVARDIRERPGQLGDVIKQRKTLYLNNTIKSETGPLQQPASILDKPTRCYVGIPLMVRERVIGVMAIQSYRPDSYSEEQIHILEQIAIQAAIAIENARLYSEVQRLAIVDELTGVYNYRGLMVLGSREVERARRFGRPLSILFSDIDDFRNFNNTYSHSTGNIILQSVMQRFRDTLRSVDVITRYGGDEFVTLLPETDLVEAEAVACRLVEGVSNTHIATPFGNLSVTISIGVTTLYDNDANLSTLIERSNHAEHKAKQGQKGIVVIA